MNEYNKSYCLKLFKKGESFYQLKKNNFDYDSKFGSKIANKLSLDEFKDLMYIYPFKDLIMNKYSIIKSRKTRLNQWIKDHLKYYYCYFVTLTFDDEHINISNRYFKEKILHKLIDEKILIGYAFNVDFGIINNRIHYHGIIATCAPTFILNYQLGYYKMTLIKSSNNPNILRDYIYKMANHAFKQTDKVIYSRYNNNVDVDLKFDCMIKHLNNQID